MQIIPRNKKAIPIIKHFCRKFFNDNISHIFKFTNALGENAIICVFNSNHRLVIWYDQQFGDRTLVAIAEMNGRNLGITSKTFDTVHQLKNVLI